jgi:hypothetical protein
LSSRRRGYSGALSVLPTRGVFYTFNIIKYYRKQQLNFFYFFGAVFRIRNYLCGYFHQQVKNFR